MPPQLPIPMKQTKNKKQVAPKAPADKTPFYLVLVLFFISIVFYGNTLSNDYCLDDTMVITENSSTQKGFSGITEHLSQDLLYGFKHMKSRTAASGGYRPLSLITYSMEVGLFGKNKPGVSHCINMLLYGLIVVLLFQFLFRYVFKEVWLAFIAALLFAIHPIHTEVVANIKSRDVLLCLLFLLLALHQLWKFLETKKSLNLIFGLVWYFVSLLSKEDSITFLAGIPIMLYFFSNLERRQILIYSSAFLGSAVFYLIIRNAIVPFGGFKANPEIINNAFLLATGSQAFATKIYILLFDLKMLFFPNPLSFDYSYNQIPYQSLANPLVWISIVVYVGLLLIAIRGFKSKNIFALCALMFIVTLSISSNLIVDIGLMFGERMLFIPSIFFAIALAVLIHKLIATVEAKTAMKKLPLMSLMLFPFVSVTAWLTISRNADWKDDRTLALADISKSPNSARANSAAGAAYLFYALEANRTTSEKDSMLNVSLGYMNKSLELYADNNDVLINSGIALSELGQQAKGEECWSKVRAKNPTNPKLMGIDKFLANKYLTAGVAATNANKLDSALYYYNKSLDYSTYNDSARVSAYYNIGGVYFLKADYAAAHAALEKVMAIDANYQNVRAGYEESGRLMVK